MAACPCCLRRKGKSSPDTQTTSQRSRAGSGHASCPLTSLPTSNAPESWNSAQFSISLDTVAAPQRSQSTCKGRLPAALFYLKAQHSHSATIKEMEQLRSPPLALFQSHYLDRGTVLVQNFHDSMEANGCSLLGVTQPVLKGRRAVGGPDITVFHDQKSRWREGVRKETVTDSFSEKPRTA